MSFDPLQHFIERKEAIACFDKLITHDQQKWVMLVDGFSGTGKSLLAEWLRLHRCKDIPIAKITLSQSFNIHDLLSNIADQLGISIARHYREKISKLEVEEQNKPLIKYTPSMQASLGGSIREAKQSVELVIELGSYAQVLKVEQEARRLDRFIEALSELRNKTWVLFLDEVGHLANPELKRFIIETLVQRLRTNFSHFRLYLTGQTVPRNDFSRYEQFYITLDTFSFGYTVELLKKIRIEDEEIHKTVFAVTLGHPLLLGMIAEDISECGEQFNLADLHEIKSDLEKHESTQWIYNRIISRIEDETMREAAANLSLFEWFDLSLLRTVFSSGISEQSFNELVQRSFVKSLEAGKWRCHDIIIKHLRPHRAYVAPLETQELHRRAFEAFKARIAAEEERLDTWNFTDRISISVAALHSALEFSVAAARSLLLSEIVIGFTWFFDTEYLYGIVRFLESRSVPETIMQIAQMTKKILEAFNLKEFNQEVLQFLDEIARYAQEELDSETAAELFHVAALVSQEINRLDLALDFAQRSRELHPSEDNYRISAQILAQMDDIDTAKRLLVEAKDKYGDSLTLSLGQADIALSQGYDTEASHILIDAISNFPKAAEARLMLANLLIYDEKFNAALEQVDAILAEEPFHQEALSTRLGLLANMGRVSEAIAMTKNSSFSFASIIEDFAYFLNLFLFNPIEKGRILVQLRNDPDSVPLGLAIGLTYVLSLQGDFKAISEVANIIQAKWPETRISCQTYLAFAFFNSNQVDEALTILEPMLAAGTGNIDTYVILSLSYAHKKQFQQQRTILEQMMKRFPSTRDIAIQKIAQSYISEGYVDKAMRYLEHFKRQGVLGPYAQEALATIYVLRDEKSKALELFEQLIYAADTTNYPVQKLVEVRSKYAMLLADTGEHIKATEIAYDMLQNPLHRAYAAIQGGLIFYKLKNEDGLRKALRLVDRSSPQILLNIIGWLAELIRERNSSINGLLTEFAANPDRIEIVVAIDQLMTQNKQLNEIPTVFAKIESLAPGIVTSYLSLQQEAIAESGPASIQQLRNMKAVALDNTMICLALARLLLAQQQFEEAKEELDELTTMRPDLRDLSVNLQAIALMDAGQMDAAKSLLEPFLKELTPPFFLIEPLVKYYHIQRDIDSEIRLWISAAEAYPEYRQRAVENILEILIDLGQYKEVIDFIDSLDNSYKEQPGFMLQRADALRELGRIDEAIEVNNRLLKLTNITDELRSLIYYNRAVTLHKGNLFNDALKAYQEAIKLSPKKPTLYFDAVETLIELKEWASAYDALMSALSLAPEEIGKYENVLKDLRHKQAEAEK